MPRGHLVSDPAHPVCYPRKVPETEGGVGRTSGLSSRHLIAEREEFLPFHRPSITDDDIVAVGEALRSGWLTHGSVCREFEHEFARHVSVGRAVCVSSCTAAMH